MKKKTHILKPTCKTCPYWDGVAELPKCQKHSPCISPRADSSQTDGDGWCGEHPDFDDYILATRNLNKCEDCQHYGEKKMACRINKKRVYLDDCCYLYEKRIK